MVFRDYFRYKSLLNFYKNDKRHTLEKNIVFSFPGLIPIAITPGRVLRIDDAVTGRAECYGLAKIGTGLKVLQVVQQVD